MSGDGPSLHACDPHRPGDLILGVSREDQGDRDLVEELIAAGRKRGLPGLEAVHEQARLDEAPRGRGEAYREGHEEPAGRAVEGGYDFRLLEVRDGEEHVAASSLIKLRLALANESGGYEREPAVVAQANHFLDFDGSAAPLRLSADHSRYLREIGIGPSPGSGPRPRVRVIDSGCSGTPRVELGMNLLDGGSNVDDDHGHGSLVTAIVHECTHGPFEVFKVTDAARKATEWEVLQALSVGPMPPIVNLSMSLSFGRASCSQCGRQPVGARTSVFEERLRELAEDGVIVVVAAGNQSAERLAYPSRFSSAVAVQAWSGAPPRLAPYSNSGAADQAGARHPNVFLCPGGRREANEGPGLDGQGKPVDGTSFAAAYMSGLLAVHWAAVSRCTQACEICRAVVLERAQLAASPRFPGYDASRHGHGLARLP